MIRVGYFPNRANNGSINLGAQAILGVADELRDLHGFELLVDQKAGVDLLCIHKEHLQRDLSPVLGGPVPLIIDEERDAPLMSPLVRKWLSDGLAVGCLKNYLYTDRERYNDKSGEEFDTRLLELSAAYSTYQRLDVLGNLSIDWEAPRRFDVHFAGWMSYKQSAAQVGREKAADAVVALGGRVYRGRMPLPDYYSELLNSKICLSPWGWAAPCHRDAEGILCGCVVVKPWCDDIEGNPNIYRAGETYETCREDYSNLPGVVGRILDNWGQWEQRRRDNRNWLIESSRRWRLAAHIARVFGRCWERASNG